MIVILPEVSPPDATTIEFFFLSLHAKRCRLGAMPRRQHAMRLKRPTSLIAVHARKSAMVREIVNATGNTWMNADADRQTMLDRALLDARVNNAERRAIRCWLERRSD